MIYKSGQPITFEAKDGIDLKSVMGLIETSNEALLKQIAFVVADRLASMPTLGGVASASGSMTAEETAESLRRLAKAMSLSQSVDGTNIDGLGKEQKMKADKGRADRTIELLDGIP